VIITKRAFRLGNRRLCQIVAVSFLLSLRSGAQPNSDSFFVVLSKNSGALTSLGTPSVNNFGDIVLRTQTLGNSQHRIIFNRDQLRQTAQGNTPSLIVRSNVNTLSAFPTISDSDSIVSYVIGGGLQFIDICNLDIIEPEPGSDPIILGITQDRIAAANPAQPTSPFAFLSPIAAVDGSNIYFYGEPSPFFNTYERAIYHASSNVSNPALVTPIVGSPDVFSSLDPYVACSPHNGNVVYRGTGAKGTGIYRGANGIAVATDQIGLGTTGTRPSINSSATAAFYGILNGAYQSVFLRSTNEPPRFRVPGNFAQLINPLDGLIASGVVPTGYASLQRISLNDFNQVSFVGTNGSGKQSIFTSAMGTIRRILSVGDTLRYNGTNVQIAGVDIFNGLGTNGQTVFFASTVDGDQLIVRANRGFTQNQRADSPIDPSYKTNGYLLRDDPTRFPFKNNYPSGTIWGFGCNFVSTVNLMVFHGAETSPLEFQEWLVKNYKDSKQKNPAKYLENVIIPDAAHSFTNGNVDFSEYAVQEFTRYLMGLNRAVHEVRWIRVHNNAKGTPNFDKLISELRAGRAVKVCVPNTKDHKKPLTAGNYGKYGHYILAYGLREPSVSSPTIEDILVMDPANAINTLGEYGRLPNTGATSYNVIGGNWLEDNHRLTLYGAGVDTVNPGLSINVQSPVEILLTDPFGRRLGINPAVGQFSEIPGGDYYPEEPYYAAEGSPEDGSSVTGRDESIKKLFVENVTEGLYTLQLYGTGDGEYHISIGTGDNLLPSVTSLSGTITNGETKSLQLVLSNSCAFTLSPSTANVTAESGMSSFLVTGDVNCAWIAKTTNNWIHTTDIGSGNGSVSFTFDSSVFPRAGSITVGSQVFTVNQAGAMCACTLFSNSKSVDSEVGSGSVGITISNNCSWNAFSSNDWLHTSSSGSGNGVINYSFDANTNTGARAGVIYIENQIFTVNQAGLTIVPLTNGLLHNFTGTSDGDSPEARLVLLGNTLYGTTRFGGSADNGSVFKVNTDGTGFTNLHIFTATSGYTNDDGSNPIAGLVLSGGTLYGTAANGGFARHGTIFKVNTDGTGFTILHSFTKFPASPTGNTNIDGAGPIGGLVLSGNTLYGTTAGGGSSGNGVLFAIPTDGTGFTNLHSFDGSDGSSPQASLINSGDTLYGTAEQGGNGGRGTVFKINIDGTSFTVLHDFTAISPGTITNSDGTHPMREMILSGSTLYGTAWGGGSSGYGTVFAVKIDGTDFMNLHSFSSSDGVYPYSGLALFGNTLVGTTSTGNRGNGTVFAINTDGTDFSRMHVFFGYPGDGSIPEAGLVVSGNSLYGTTDSGGSSDYGTVFMLTFGLINVPHPAIIASTTNVVLTWPANANGFSLQSTTNLTSPVIWSSVLPGPTVINNENTVTNQIFGTQRFYRLSH
jgi:uncharacterized repeat protein (TIGR03803 family)